MSTIRRRPLIRWNTQTNILTPPIYLQVKPRICSSHLLRLVNPCCNACLLLWNPRASHGVAKGNYWHLRASLVSPYGWNKTTRCTCSRLRHDFVPHHIYWYACVAPAECLEATPKGMKWNNKFKYRLAFSYKPLQLRVSLQFSTPRYDAYCKIWVLNCRITSRIYCLH